MFPSAWYLTGYIVPSNTPPMAVDTVGADEDLDEVPDRAADSEEAADEGKTARRGYFPSSIGISFQVGPRVRALDVLVRWGDYTPEEEDGKAFWQRRPHEARVALSLPEGDDKQVEAIPDSGGLELETVRRAIRTGSGEAGEPGLRSVSIFLVNRRTPDEDARDQTFAFQPEIEVTSQEPFPSKATTDYGDSGSWDDDVARLHYRDTPEYATGHGVSADWEVVDGQCRTLRTTWIGRAEVESISTSVDDIDLSMEVLGDLPDGAAATEALTPLVDRYRSWIEAEAAKASSTDPTAQELLHRARFAAGRIELGIKAIADDPNVLDAFRVANRAVGRALRHRIGIEKPAWRAFQLAFILLNAPGLAQPENPTRNIVDLLFFPTGGGKTEAYLGLAAFTMVLRRLRHPESDGHQAAGVCVIMRYTLRLLTLDQLSRAAGLMCALEIERSQNENRYGTWPFEIGLWVGKAATPNKMGAKGDKEHDSARLKVNRFKRDPGNKPSPIPLEECPWCGAKFEPDSFHLEPDSNKPRNLRIVCTNFDCDFTGDRPLPVVAVDEPLYRRLPAFLIATVDKFASLPWTGPSGALLGGATSYDEHGFYGACDLRGGRRRLESPLLPPELIIQDELHLISGPLGTMAGLYESAIEALCLRESGGRMIRPKIIASTATARRADDQIQALFARGATQVFPPQGPDRRDSFFARTLATTDAPARLYLGIASQGRSAKVATRRVWVALMGAAMRAYRDAGGDSSKNNPADPYMTVLGYFNSLRELGGARRILEEEVQNTIKRIGLRKRLGESDGLFRDRLRFAEVVELTSRVSTAKVAQARQLLGRQFRMKPAQGERVVDCAIATNMISVGLDILRLGLMVVVGQPKTAAEYIQATSRVGRSAERPGLVVTLLNTHKPRDRSHYERFKHFHQTFYRSVEVASVTPFAARALDRGFAGALVTLARHAEALLTPPKGAGQIRSVRSELERRLETVFEERVQHQPGAEEERDEQLRIVKNRIRDLLDAWSAILSEVVNDGHELQYQKYEGSPGTGKPLLSDFVGDKVEGEHRRKFRANRSLRDVEEEVRLDLVSDRPTRSGKYDERLRVGSVRSSQMVTTYGPGSLIDLPSSSVIVAGLDTWLPQSPTDRLIIEDRLSAKLQGMTGVSMPRLHAPPPEDTFPGARGAKPSRVGVRQFPEWFVMQNPETPTSGQGDGNARVSRKLVRLQQPEGGRYERQPVVATRFVRACLRGHVDDLDWRAYAHGEHTACTQQLWLDERGQSGDLSDLVVRCGCGKSRLLGDAADLKANALGTCTGRRPWLGKYAREDCGLPSRLLIRTATNSYFPLIVRVLSIPDSQEPVNDAVSQQWGILQAVNTSEMLETFRGIPAVSELRGRFSDADLYRAIRNRRDRSGDSRTGKEIELDAFLAAPEGFGEDIPVNPDFHARALPASEWNQADISDRIDTVVQLHRLREVSALAGFTRLDAAIPDINGEYDTGAKRADLDESPTWFPAIENRGEGIFVALSPAAVRDWLARSDVQARIASLREGHQKRLEVRKEKERPFPGGPYVLLHTLSHLLMQSVALRCGYPATSIRERIYLDEAGQRYGLLLYTASPDAEGTLGGLVQQARHVNEHVEQALKAGWLCSSDPICAQHSPESSSDERWLHGAACHNCCLVAETSCEMWNEYLDRALVVPTVDTPGASFFPQPE